jgi:ATP-dependent DNA ligase
MPTEDHPIEYAEFEGIISEREYGSGTMIAWDTCYYEQNTPGKDEEERSV